MDTCRYQRTFQVSNNSILQPDAALAQIVQMVSEMVDATPANAPLNFKSLSKA